MKKTFLVALHAHHRKQVFDEAEKILTSDGAHGVLLVNNGGYVRCDTAEYPNLFDIAIELKSTYPDFLIGINPLDLTPTEAMRRTIDTPLDILWTGNAGIIERDNKAYLNNTMEVYLPKLKAAFYGGVAFKGQPQPKNLKTVIQYAAKRFGQVITSGEATGKAASLDKIISLKQMIGNTPLGIASGLSVENVREYLPYTDILIVASSLTAGDFFTYHSEKIKQFRKAIEV